jgi:hypothetical protein
VTTTVNAVTPSLCDIAGGGVGLKIRGSGFLSAGAASSVTIGGTAATSFTVDSDVQITAVPAAHVAATAQDVVVVSPAGTGTGVGLVEYWSPLQITGIDTYLDANKNVTQSVGSISSVADQNSARTWDMASGLRQPQQVASVFGTLPSIRCASGSATCLQASAARDFHLTGSSQFFVGKTTSSNATAAQPNYNAPNTVLSWYNGWSGFGFSGADAWLQGFNPGGTASNSLSTSGLSLNDGIARLLGITSDASGNSSVYVGGALHAIESSGALLAYGCSQVGAGAASPFDGSTSGDGLDGDIGAVILVSGIISAGDLAKLVVWATQRFGIQPAFSADVPMPGLYPDVVDRRQVSALHASRQSFTSSVPPIQLAAAAPAIKRPVHPDIIDRSRWHASRVPHTTGGNAFPIGAGASSVSPQKTARFPDRIDRPSLHASQQLAVGDMPAFPWLAGASSALKTQPPEFPDAVVRPFLRPEQQLAVTSLSPAPERKSPLAATVYPDAISRPSLRTEQQLATTRLSPLPERKSPLAAPTFPDLFFRPWFAVTQQQATTNETPSPLGAGASSALVAQPSVFPDFVLRPSLAAPNHPALASLSTFQFATSTTPVALASYVDAVARAAFRAEQQLAVSSIPPFQVPAASTPVALTTYPDAPARALMRAEQHLAITGVPANPIGPGASSALPFQPPSFPATVLRASLPTAGHLAATAPPPAPERTSTLASVSYPDGVVRPWFRVETQLAASSVSPSPERTSALAAVVFPDTVTRAWFGVPNQLAATALSPAPERTSALAVASYPDAVVRPSLRAEQHLALADIDPLPFAVGAPFQPPVFPPTVTRAWLPTAQQLAASEIPPFPLVLAITPVALASYTDALARPSLRAEAQLATTELSALPQGAGPSSLLFQPPSFPHAIARPFLRAEQQLAASEVPAFPLSLSVVPYELTWYPDAVVRPSMGAERQIAATEIAPFPLGAGASAATARCASARRNGRATEAG